MDLSVDSTNQAQEIMDLPLHLQDGVWRVESAGLRVEDSAGLVIAGMGGSGIGGALAVAAIGDRATAPIVGVRDYTLPAWVDERWTVLLSSYSGSTEETLACWDEATARGLRRIVSSTGGPLVDRARAAEVPVVPLPAGFQPRAAVGYATAVAIEAARVAGVAPDLRDEVNAAAQLLKGLATDWGPDGDGEPHALARAIGDKVPVVVGAGLTVPAAYRLKCQVNENANRAAFCSELPEADHNEIEGWGARDHLVPVFLVDPVDTHPRVLERFDLTADIIGGALRAEARGETRTERLLSLVHLGDLASLYLAVRDGTDPVAIPALLDLKARLSA